MSHVAILSLTLKTKHSRTKSLTHTEFASNGTSPLLVHVDSLGLKLTV